MTNPSTQKHKVKSEEALPAQELTSISTLPQTALTQILVQVPDFTVEKTNELLRPRKVSRAWLNAYENAFSQIYSQTQLKRPFGPQPLPYELVDSPTLPDLIALGKIYLSAKSQNELGYTLRNPKGELIHGVLNTPFPAEQFLLNKSTILAALAKHTSCNIVLEEQKREIDFFLFNKEKILNEVFYYWDVFITPEEQNAHYERKSQVAACLRELADKKTFLTESVFGFYKRENILNKINALIFQQRIEVAKKRKDPTFLDVSRSLLTRFPKEVINHNKAYFRNLVFLSLSANYLQQLPDEIEQMQNLFVLNASSNYLNTLPPQIGKLMTLQYLSVTKNQLEHLPQEIVQLSNLQLLLVGENKITHFPTAILSLSQLKSLELRDNELTTLPGEIAQLQELETLLLERNQITHLPPEIGQMSALKTLHLNNNALLSLPTGITSLTLTILLIGNNFLTELPSDLNESILKDSKANILKSQRKASNTLEPSTKAIAKG